MITFISFGLWPLNTIFGHGWMNFKSFDLKIAKLSELYHDQVRPILLSLIGRRVFEGMIFSNLWNFVGVSLFWEVIWHRNSVEKVSYNNISSVLAGDILDQLMVIFSLDVSLMAPIIANAALYWSISSFISS